MRRVPATAPEVYQQFMAGQFPVKRKPGQFKAVAADMCLEQTINRSQKSPGGIIGSTKKKKFVAQWEINYHELLSVSNLYRQVSGVTNGDDFEVNHEFNDSETKFQEQIITKMVEYIMTKPCNVTWTKDI